jgi:hypothetical protein
MRLAPLPIWLAWSFGVGLAGALGCLRSGFVYKLVPQLNTLIRDAIFAQAVADRVAVCFSGFFCLSSQRDCNYECYDAALLA